MKYRRTTCSKCGKPAISYKPVVTCQMCRRKARVRVCARKGCGAEFPIPCNQGGKRFCSPECFHLAKVVTYRKTCPVCLREFETDARHYRQRTCLRDTCVTTWRLFGRFGWTTKTRAMAMAAQDERRREEQREYVRWQLERIRQHERRNNGL